jgi:acyl-CoA reductase-like NAD-dependent aldehyde dehydrogenase
VIYLLVPFNFPLWLTFKGGIPNLYLGNSLLMRNSDSTPQLAEKIE